MPAVGKATAKLLKRALGGRQCNGIDTGSEATTPFSRPSAESSSGLFPFSQTTDHATRNTSTSSMAPGRRGVETGTVTDDRHIRRARDSTGSDAPDRLTALMGWFDEVGDHAKSDVMRRWIETEYRRCKHLEKWYRDTYPNEDVFLQDRSRNAEVHGLLTEEEYQRFLMEYETVSGADHELNACVRDHVDYISFYVSEGSEAAVGTTSTADSGPAWPPSHSMATPRHQSAHARNSSESRTPLRNNNPFLRTSSIYSTTQEVTPSRPTRQGCNQYVFVPPALRGRQIATTTETATTPTARNPFETYELYGHSSNKPHEATPALVTQDRADAATIERLQGTTVAEYESWAVMYPNPGPRVTAELRDFRARCLIFELHEIRQGQGVGQRSSPRTSGSSGPFGYNPYIGRTETQEPPRKSRRLYYARE